MVLSPDTWILPVTFLPDGDSGRAQAPGASGKLPFLKAAYFMCGEP